MNLLMRCYDATMDSLQASLDKHESASFDEWLTQLRATRLRGTLVFAGEASWCREVAASALADSSLARITWISTIEHSEAEVFSAKQAKGLLGQERDAIVFDAHSGFDADAFGAVSGAIVGGGLLVLLCPTLDEWPQFADPAAESIAVWPHPIEGLSGHFLQRVSGLLNEAMTAREQIAVVTPNEELDVQLQVLLDYSSPKIPFSKIENSDELFRTDDQRNAVTAIEHVLHGHRRRPLVLVADRGRGKTAALGIAAAQLLRSASHGISQAAHVSPRPLRIVVTAPRLAAVTPLFQHAANLLPDADIQPAHLQWGEAEIQFLAPDELCAIKPSADLLLVDEAAAIPVSILQPLLKHYSRIVFSTTTHGYEGTGRGFAVRFRQTLNEQTPGWSELVLHEPIRWASGDPLEKLVFDSLLLNAKCAEDDVVSSIDVDRLQVECIQREQLVNDESLLAQLFGLLVVAHYRTRPNDLRNLLDGPGLNVYVMRDKGVVVATALVTKEGGFDQPLAEEITAGYRRPRGHLIPQSLMAHLGLKSAGELHCARVMRIAVHPALQGRGLGRQMLQTIKSDASKQGADLMGASFGATVSLLTFWRDADLWPVRMGFQRGHSSGEHSVMVLSGLSEAGTSIVSKARTQLLEDFPQTLSDPLCDLNTRVVALLLHLQPGQKEIELNQPSLRDLDNVRSFVADERNYEDCLASIWRCVVWALRDSKQTFTIRGQNKEQAVVISKVLQKHAWAQVAQQFDLTGKAAVVQNLQLGLSQLLQDVLEKQ